MVCLEPLHSPLLQFSDHKVQSGGPECWTRKVFNTVSQYVKTKWFQTQVQTLKFSWKIGIPGNTEPTLLCGNSWFELHSSWLWRQSHALQIPGIPAAPTALTPPLAALRAVLLGCVVLICCQQFGLSGAPRLCVVHSHVPQSFAGRSPDFDWYKTCLLKSGVHSSALAWSVGRNTELCRLVCAVQAGYNLLKIRSEKFSLCRKLKSKKKKLLKAQGKENWDMGELCFLRV